MLNDRSLQGFRRDLEELEPTESLNLKIADRNARIRSVHQRISGLGDQQRELAEEKQQHQEILRFASITGEGTGVEIEHGRSRRGVQLGRLWLYVLSMTDAPSPPEHDQSILLSLRQSEEQLQQMNNVWTQRLEKLRHRDPATVQVVKWLKNNQHKFRQPILEPVCMSLNVQDPRYVKQAESFFSSKDFCSFVAQNEEDREVFLREVGTDVAPSREVFEGGRY